MGVNNCTIDDYTSFTYDDRYVSSGLWTNVWEMQNNYGV